MGVGAEVVGGRKGEWVQVGRGDYSNCLPTLHIVLEYKLSGFSPCHAERKNFILDVSKYGSLIYLTKVSQFRLSAVKPLGPFCSSFQSAVPSVQQNCDTVVLAVRFFLLIFLTAVHIQVTAH